MNQSDFRIPRLGPAVVPSPIEGGYFVDDSLGIFLDARVEGNSGSVADRIVVEAAGPRKCLYFNPREVRAAIVSCGGLCPGINDVIRAVTMVLWYRYGVRDILGLRYGYEGLVRAVGHKPLRLTPEDVEDIHQHGGTILGTSRGPQKVPEMVRFLQEEGINMLFTIGGDGTQRGAREIVDECAARGLRVAVVGIPKTIDN
ncbi:MAG: 6-phosphofructokinase, partial [Kiritimatiellae bacterium]|nr:6-phosphofructokinase [Kiritimatiellia bacterium]